MKLYIEQGYQVLIAGNRWWNLNNKPLPRKILDAISKKHFGFEMAIGSSEPLRSETIECLEIIKA